MFRKTYIYRSILILFILVSLYFIYLLLDKFNNLNYYVIFPLITLIMSLTLLITNVSNHSNAIKQNELSNRLKLWNNITYKVKKAGETAFNKLPIGIVVINNSYQIIWSNSFAKEIFMSPLDDISMPILSKEIYEKISEITSEDNIEFDINIYGVIYHVEYLVSNNVLYLSNINEYKELQIKYDNNINAIGYINVDNLEEALADFDVQERAEYHGKIIGTIAKWAEQFGAYARAYSDSRYLMILSKENLEAMMKDNFTVLDTIKDIIRTSRIVKLTLSIGISCSDHSINDIAEDAEGQLELALSRGGDQAVVKLFDQLNFFGAKTDALPKDSKVEIRNRSQELQELISTSSKVFVVGHKNSDADSFASTLAIYRFARAHGVEAYMVVDEDSIDPTVTKVIDDIKLEFRNLYKVIISSKKAISLADKSCLLVVVDCQQNRQLAEPKLPNKFQKIAIIDHHRRSAEDGIMGKFHHASTSASSTVELIFDLLEFSNIKIDMSELEATFMLLGIVVDTNNFVYRTSANTFNVASILKQYGADMNAVKEYLKEDINDKIIRSRFIDTVDIINDHIAIAVGEDDTIHERSTLAKVSDELISIEGISLGITIGLIGDNEIGLSARSLGKINCQALMEKMKGGGHLNNAAAQVKDSTISEVKEDLKKKLDSFVAEDVKMKVILLKDIKGKGKKGDTLDLQPGYANYIVKAGQAMLATAENINTVEEEKELVKIKAEKLLTEMKELKVTIESSPIKIGVKVGKEQKMFGTVSTKQIADAIEEKFNKKVDKRKINLAAPINTLGTFNIEIQLHKEVNAVIKLFVVENDK